MFFFIKIFMKIEGDLYDIYIEKYFFIMEIIMIIFIGFKIYIFIFLELRYIL